MKLQLHIAIAAEVSDHTKQLQFSLSEYTHVYKITDNTTSFTLTSTQ